MNPTPINSETTSAMEIEMAEPNSVAMELHKERLRQIGKEGWTEAHDDTHCDLTGLVMAPMTEWTEWIEHDGGECPIPDAKAGEFAFKRRDGVIKDYMIPHARYWKWITFGLSRYDIIAYRLRRAT